MAYRAQDIAADFYAFFNTGILCKFAVPLTFNLSGDGMDTLGRHVRWMCMAGG